MEMENKTEVKGFVFPSSNKCTQMVVEKKIFLFPSSIMSTQTSEERVWMERVEIDTSAPFRSVKEAVDLFGGRGSWKPCQVEKKKKKKAEGACEPDSDRSVLTELLNRADGFQTTAKGMEKDGSFLEKELDRTRAMLDRTKLMLQLTKDGESASPRSVVDENSVKGEGGSPPPVKTLEVAEKAVKLQVEEAKKVKIELLEKVEAAKVDIDTGREALEEALLKVEEVSRNYRYGRFDKNIPRKERSVKCADSRKRRRRCIHKSTRFKNSSAISSSGGASAATTRMLLEGVGGGRKMVATTATSSATLSIGQILRMKLIGSEGMEIGSDDEPISLREMLKRKL